MLDSIDCPQDVNAWIQSLPCQVNIPAAMADDFEKWGPVPTVFDDIRSGVRICCRGHKKRAALELKQNYVTIPRKTEWQAVFTANISKKGCGILHSQPLYPGERFSLVLMTGLRRTIEIAWCRRLDKNCFEVGSRFVDAAEALAQE